MDVLPYFTVHYFVMASITLVKCGLSGENPAPSRGCRNSRPMIQKLRYEAYPPPLPPNISIRANVQKAIIEVVWCIGNCRCGIVCCLLIVVIRLGREHFVGMVPSL